jgi:predicted aminopeptidase
MWHSRFAKSETDIVMNRILKWLVFSPVLLLISGCGTVAYYSQMINGHLTLMSEAKPVDRLLASPKTPEKLKQELEWAKKIRNFAFKELKLPDNGSYRKYVQLDRPYVLWNVVATPELSLVPKTTCSPIAGCVAYRAYYHKEAAEKYAGKLKRKAYDTYVGGVIAYSTIGWFRDPLVSSMMRGGVPDLAGVIFHELGHQAVFTKSDTAFVESFATVVETEGLRRWLRQQNDKSFGDYLTRHKRYDQLTDLMLKYRKKLQAVYTSNQDDNAKRAQKKKLFAELLQDYERLKKRWGGYNGYDKWMLHDMNNAKLASVGNYRQWVPSLEHLLRECGGDLPCFYRRANKIAKLKPEARLKELKRLAQS